mmetsp:Transcript_38180/g.109024  ORF Transcript_38180/g.109024 Transcript_38180/m.109024 type:complete len:647 (+) Transcript_38180:106-2046(+)
MAITTHRTQRRTEEYLLPKFQTRDHVAPGTYSNTHNEPSKPPPESGVPFSSLQEKVLNPNGHASALTPGPGAYLGTAVGNGPGKKANGDEFLGLGSTSLRSRAARLAPAAPGSSIYLASSAEANPGPGRYKTESDGLADRPAKEIVVPLKPVLDAHEKTVPSIPPQRLRPEERAEGDASPGDVSNLYMRHTGDDGDTAGPGTYDPKGEHITQKSRPQTSFHTSKQKRTLWEPSSAVDCNMPPRENPGPGTYIMKGALGDLESLGHPNETPSTFQFSSQSNLPHQVQVNPDKVAPGPGQYKMDGDIDRTVKSARERTASVTDRTRFGGMSERTGWQRPLHQPYKDPYFMHVKPGPGSYPSAMSDFPADPKKKEAEKAIPGARRRKLHGIHHPALIMALQEAPGPLQAFNSTDDRPCNKEAAQRTPAPWEYNKEEARSHSMMAALRERAKVGRRGVFGTCADRFYGSPLEGRSGLPEPGSVEEKQGGANSEPRSVFQSQSPRFHAPAGPHESMATKLGQHQTPAPGDYFVENVPNYRSPYRIPRQDRLSFGSGQERFDSERDVFAGHMPGLPNPGPGDYPERPRPTPRGVAAIRAKRKPLSVGCTAEGVGPGSYGEDISTHMLKKTHNVTTEGAVAVGEQPARRLRGP